MVESKGTVEVNVRINSEVRDRLKEYCGLRGISQGEAIQRALNELMTRGRGRPVKYVVTLSDIDRAELLRIIKKEKPDSKRVVYAKALLALDTVGGCMSPSDVTSEYHITNSSLVELRVAYCKGGIDAALGKRLCYGHRVTEDIKANIIALTRIKPPNGHPRWTYNLLAKKAVEFGYVETISRNTIRNILKCAGISL